MNQIIDLSASKNNFTVKSGPLRTLQSKGYIYDFRLKEDNQLVCLQIDKIFSSEMIKVKLADLWYNYTTHMCRYVHTIDSMCGIKGLLVAEKIYLPNQDVITKLIEKYNELSAATQCNDFPGLHIPKRKPAEDRLLVRYKDKIIPLPYTDIALFYLEHELIQLTTFSGKSYFVQRSLEDLEKNLGVDFYRVNRQALVNKMAIKDLSISLNRTITVNLNCTFSQKIVVSKLRSNIFLDWLSTNPSI